MLRSAFWLILLFLSATALDAWVLWLQMQFENHIPTNYLYAEAIVVELVILVFTLLAFSEIVRSHHRVRTQAAERVKAARLEGTQSGMHAKNS